MIEEEGMARVLLVDDDPSFCALVVPHLEAEGHEVVQVTTANEAMHVQQTRACDVAIVDGVLPDESGTDLIARMQAAGIQPTVVFVSAVMRDLGTYRLLTKDLGVALVVYKPIAPHELVARIGILLQLAPSTPVPAVKPTPVAALEARLLALRSTYTQALPAKIEDVLRHVRRVQMGPAPEHGEMLEHTIMLAHRLRGTAGSYGYSGVGDAMGAVEDALTSLREGPPARLKHFWQAVHAHIHEAQICARLPDARQSGATQPHSFSHSNAQHGRKFLVLECDNDVFAAAERTEKSLIADFVRTNSVELARALVRSQDIDAALIEFPVNLADHDELLAFVGELGVPFAALSTDASTAMRAHAAIAGASLFLTLPAAGATMTQAVRRLIEEATRERPRVLLVDDDPDFRVQACTILQAHGFETTETNDLGGLFELLEQARPDLVLLDVGLPNISGLDVCRAIRTSPRWETLPVVFVTAAQDRESRLATFRAGGDDYLVKPVVAEELIARVRVRADRQRQQRQSHDIDPVTGLPVRRAFLRDIVPRLDEARRHHRPLSLCVLDLDNFKGINDTHGHFAGDQVLEGLGNILQERFRSYDLRARWGGEEFVLAFPGESMGVVAQIVGKTLDEFASLCFFDDEGRSFSASFTAGVASFPEDGHTLETLLTVADHRLYAGKQAGRRCVMAGSEPRTA